MSIFGWYGRLESRDSRGELADADPISPIRYVDYDEALFKEVASSNALAFLSFSVDLEEMATTEAATVPTEATSLPIPLLLGVGVGVIMVVLVVFMIIALVCVFGRKQHQPKKKKK